MVSRPTRGGSCIFRRDHPSRPKAMICCFFSSFKTFAMSREATDPPAAVNVLDVSSESMAAFQVFLYGRFWVFTEDPTQGALPSEPFLCKHAPLQSNQVQFVIGTLLQLDRYNKREGWPHQCQILRFYCSNSKPSILSVERLLAARQSGLQYKGVGIGPYKIVPISPESEQVAEEISFVV